MKYFLLMIPVITTILGLFLYRLQDRQLEIFKLDLVQFIYLFVLTPTMYVWSKSFLFYILRNELELKLSVTDLFVIDTIFSVFVFIIVAAIAIHSLVKTFRLKRDYNPHFDLFHLSEYFHLWWTHIVMTSGLMLLTTFISVANIIVPFSIEVYNKPQFYLLLLVAVVFGGLIFLGLWMTDAKQSNYMRIMKLLLAFFLLVHILIYFIVDPGFNVSYGAYWFIFMMFFSAVSWSSIFEKQEKTNKIRDFFTTHANWGNNIDLFGKRKK